MKQKRKRLKLTDKERDLIETIRLIPNVYPMRKKILILTAQEILDDLLYEKLN